MLHRECRAPKPPNPKCPTKQFNRYCTPSVEECQRLSRVDAFDPESCLAQLDCHGVTVDTEQAPAGHFAERMTPIFRRRSTRATELRHPSRQLTPRGKQEMPRAASGIQDREIQECIDRAARVLVDRSLNHRLQSAGEQQLDQAIRSVIAARSLARVALVSSPTAKKKVLASRSKRGGSSNRAS